MRSAAVLLACRAAGLAPSPTRRHILALLGGAAPAAAAAAPSLPARDSLMYIPNMCELNAHMLLRELRAKGIAADAVVAPDTFLYRQRGGAEDGRKGWDFHVFVIAGTDVYDRVASFLTYLFRTMGGTKSAAFAEATAGEPRPRTPPLGRHAVLRLRSTSPPASTRALKTGRSPAHAA